MKVKSKLADVDFAFGRFEYKKDHLIIHSAPSQSMQTKVYVSPDDILAALGKAISNPRVWGYVLAFPFFLIRYRLRRRARARASGRS
ncbi:MAG: hypothetical protein AAGA23_08575 [Pseudomonadota bacterium]